MITWIPSRDQFFFYFVPYLKHSQKFTIFSLHDAVLFSGYPCTCIKIKWYLNFNLSLKIPYALQKLHSKLGDICKLLFPQTENTNREIMFEYS